MRLFVRKANIAKPLRTTLERLGVAVVQRMVANENVNEWLARYNGQQPAPDVKPAVLEWLTEQYHREERKETWSLIMEFAIAVFVFAELTTSIFAGHHRVNAPTPTTKLSASEIFELRAKCQEIVDKDVKEGMIGVVGKALTSGVAAHYNPVTNRCYAKISVSRNHDYASTIADNYFSLALYDAQTRNLLLVANRAGDMSTAQDLRKENITSSFDEVTDKIKSLMAQEQPDN